MAATASSASPSALYFFGRNKSEAASEDDAASEERKDDEKGKPSLGSVIPWFAKRLEEQPIVAGKEESSLDTPSKETSTTATVSAPTATIVETKPLSIEEQALKLRAEAERTRLEAERMDAELTLQKIARLEKELAHQQALVNSDTDQDKRKQPKERLEEIQREMEALQNKLLKTSGGGTAAKTSSQTSATSTATTTTDTSTDSTEVRAGMFNGELSKIVVDFSEEKFQKTLDYIENAPPLIRKTMALDVELEFDTVEDINATELAMRIDQMNRLDFSYSRRPPPRFTNEEIEERVRELGSRASQWSLNSQIKKKAGDNTTKLALLSLEYDHYTEEPQDVTIDVVEELIEGEDWLQPVLVAMNKSAVDGTIETLFPQCTRKEETSPPPTLAQVQQLMGSVLP